MGPKVLSAFSSGGRSGKFFIDKGNEFRYNSPCFALLVSKEAGIAQLVEHNLAKVGVASSSLVSRSIYTISRFEVSSDLFSSWKLAWPGIAGVTSFYIL
jgi:hypothetical protein